MAQLLSRPAASALLKRPLVRAGKPLAVMAVKCYADEPKHDKAKVAFQLPHHVDYGQDMCLVGDTEELGSWDVNQCIPMAWHEGDVWTAKAELPVGVHLEYKYIVRDGDDKHVHEWQPCNNLDIKANSPELTVRDGWEGSSHEILPGLLSIEIPQPPKAAAPTTDIAKLDEPKEAGDEGAIVLADTSADTISPANIASGLTIPPAATPAVMEHTPVPADQLAAGLDADSLTDSFTLKGAAAAPSAAAAGRAPVITAEELAATAAAIATAAAPVVLAGKGGSNSDKMQSPGPDTEQVMASADEEMAANIKQLHQNALTSGWFKQQVQDGTVALASSSQCPVEAAACQGRQAVGSHGSQVLC
eukprot:GHRR01008324.1.p1 GENE.GHRR01008324.1~~GHRR01008324.1.p1  ORF type:complete len:360 (+),score=131.26 GHRR01008324.1:192-1271(+)